MQGWDYPAFAAVLEGVVVGGGWEVLKEMVAAGVPDFLPRLPVALPGCGAGSEVPGLPEPLPAG